MKKILLINCYFGAFPPFYDLFLRSCENNKDVDFLFFTDCKIGYTPKNVTYINTTFSNLKELIQSKFDFEITLDTPYKLCDYKPAYGYIFEKYLTGYDFWGYCDIDLIFGQIRNFITEDILACYDKIYQLGHLTLYRNNYSINRIFMDAGNPFYKDAFTTPIITVFDETEGIQRKFEYNGKKIYISRDYADITPRHYQLRLSDSYIDFPKKQNNYKHQVFVYENGKINRYALKDNNIVSDEFIYIHFQRRSMPVQTKDKERFFITCNGFEKKLKNDVTEEDIRSKNRNVYIKDIQTFIGNKLYLYKRKVFKILGRTPK